MKVLLETRFPHLIPGEIEVGDEDRETFTQLSLQDSIAAAVHNRFPSILLGVVVRDDQKVSLYDGVALNQFYWMDNPLDPQTSRPALSVHYFAHKGMSPEGHTFEELSAREIGQVKNMVVALAKDNPHLEEQARLHAIDLVAKSYIDLYDETRATDWLEKAGRWISYRRVVSEELDEMGSMIESLHRNRIPKVATQSKKAKTEACMQDVLELLEEYEEPITSREIQSELVEWSITQVQAALQKLVHQGRVIEQNKRFTSVKRDSFDEAVVKIAPETVIERQIVGDRDWLAGAAFGKVRKGHPEGQIVYHILEVLGNVKRWYGNDPDLRLLAILHDTFKHQVDPKKPKYGENHHGAYAKQFASRFIDDEELLEVLRRHDDAYHIYMQGKATGNWEEAEERAKALIQSFPERHRLYLDFYACDCKTGTKSHMPYQWFEKIYSASSTLLMPTAS